MKFIGNRPAETGGGVSAAIAIVLVNLFHIKDPALITSLVVIVGAIPAAITWLVTLFRGSKGSVAP